MGQTEGGAKAVTARIQRRQDGVGSSVGGQTKQKKGESSMMLESEFVNIGLMNALNNRRRKNEKTGQLGSRDGKRPVFRLGLQGGLELRTSESQRLEPEEGGFPRRQRQPALCMETESPESPN